VGLVQEENISWGGIKARPHPDLLPLEKEEYWEMSVCLDGSGGCRRVGVVEDRMDNVGQNE
jgi:hypothetical protein